jgi:hypothetical protein
VEFALIAKMLMTPGFGLFNNQGSFLSKVHKVENMKNYLYVFIGGAAGGFFEVMTRGDNAFHRRNGLAYVDNITRYFCWGCFFRAQLGFSASPACIWHCRRIFGAFTTFPPYHGSSKLLQTGDVEASLVSGCVLHLRDGTTTEWGFVWHWNWLSTWESCEIPGTGIMVPVPIQEGGRLMEWI